MMSLSDHYRSRLLDRGLLWLARLRWAAGTIILLYGLLDAFWLRWYQPGAAAVAVLGASLLVCNGAIWIAFSRIRRQPNPAAPLLSLASIEIALDLVFISMICVWTGGIHSPALPFFFFHVIFASLLQPPARAYAAALLAVLLVTGGLWYSYQLPAFSQEWILAASWVFTLMAVVSLTESITRVLHRRELTRVRQVTRLRELTNRLRDQQRALVQSEKMVAVGRLAAGIAHEINNPLAGMDSALQLMQRKPDVPKPQTIVALREQIQRIHRTIRQLNAFAHPGKGMFQLVPVNDVVRSAMELLSLDKRLQNVRIESRLGENAGSARLNTHAIEQVIANLIGNAIDATHGSGDPRIVISTGSTPTHCLISVTDNGSGIAKENMPHLFEPFFTTKPIGRGTGLGLSISARLVREHSGTIEVESELGKGSTFTIRIPTSAPPASQAPE